MVVRDDFLSDDESRVPEKLHQSVNQVIIQGWVNKKEIEETTKDGKEFIRANIDIRTSETNIIPVEMFAARLTKDGRENSIYKGIGTIGKEYADATQVEKWQDATKVRITAGQIRSNDFLGQNDEEIHTSVKYNTNFMNRVNDGDDFVPQAKFNIEVIFVGDREETKDGDPTGRGFIDAYYVDYNGKLNSVYFTVPEKFWNKVQGELEKGETIYVYGDIVSSVITKTITVEADFGSDDERIIHNTVKERIVKGLKRVEEEKSFEKKLIKEAMKQRVKDLEGLKAKGLFTGNSGETKKAEVINDDNELPFLLD